MSRPRRIEFRPDERTMAHLEAEHARTGASFAEIIRRALVPPQPKVTNYAPEIERRAVTVLVPR